MATLRESLDTILSRHEASFSIKLNSAQQEITAAIERSSERVLRKVNGFANTGHHELYENLSRLQRVGQVEPPGSSMGSNGQHTDCFQFYGLGCAIISIEILC